MKLYQNPAPSMSTIQMHEENVAEKGHSSLVIWFVIHLGFVTFCHFCVICISCLLGLGLTLKYTAAYV